MYSKFKVDIKSNTYFQKYYNIGQTCTNQQKDFLEKKLDDYIDYRTGRIDGDKLEKEWFKEINADVFISHSHADEDLAVSIAGWLKKEMNLTAFVDSSAWGHIDIILSRINDAYNIINQESNGKIYDYNKANYVASHIYLMLNSALNNMINKTECLMFINTPNSIIQMNMDSAKEQTLSPWIYSEIMMSNTMQRTPPKRPIHIEKGIRHYDAMKESMEMTHQLDFSDFMDIDFYTFLEWRIEKNLQKGHALDILYKITNKGRVD